LLVIKNLTLVTYEVGLKLRRIVRILHTVVTEILDMVDRPRLQNHFCSKMGKSYPAGPVIKS